MVKKIWDTLSKNDKLSWLSHATIAVGLALVFNPSVAIGYYAFREVEQVFMAKFVYKEPLHPLDHVMDVLSPAVAVGILQLIR